MSWTWWRYPRRRFTVGDATFAVRMWARNDGLLSRLEDESGRTLAEDSTPLFGPDSVRNHSLACSLADGRTLEVEAGYVSLWMTGIAVRVDGELVHQSHPGRTIAYPEEHRETATAIQARTLGGVFKEAVTTGSEQQGVDPGVWKRNRVPIAVDIAMGIIFFAVARWTDLPTAALVAAALGIVLLVAQRFVSVDLIGGLALFGVVMALLGAGLAVALEDDLAIRMRGALLGLISAALFLGDGVFLKGRRLGHGLMRYLPYSDLDPARLSVGVAVVGVGLAAVSAAVALYAPTDAWLFYNAFGDILVAMVLIQFAIAHARRTPTQSADQRRGSPSPT